MYLLLCDFGFYIIILYYKFNIFRIFRILVIFILSVNVTLHTSTSQWCHFEKTTKIVKKQKTNIVLDWNLTNIKKPKAQKIKYIKQKIQFVLLSRCDYNERSKRLHHLNICYNTADFLSVSASIAPPLRTSDSCAFDINSWNYAYFISFF